MTQNPPPTTPFKMSAGYDKIAIDLEQRRRAREPGSKVWKGLDQSPLAELLQKYPEFQVMIVDDNRPIRHLVRSILLAFGVQNVKEADDGIGAIKHLLNYTPDLIITDLEMAPMNGLEFTRQIRQNPLSRNPNLPIIVMTSYTEKERILEIGKAGLTEVMAKPVTPKLLRRNIITAMENYDRRLCEMQNEPATRNGKEPTTETFSALQEDADYFLI